MGTGLSKGQFLSKGNKILLLVEDDELLAMTESRWLKRAGYGVLHAKSGEEAISKMRSDSGLIDLILMDINLGSGIDGTDAAKEILKEFDVPLLFLSSHTEKEVVEKTEQITSYGYVVKDSKEVVLLASIKMAFKLFYANKAIKEKEEELAKSQARQLKAEVISGAGNYELHIQSGKMIVSDGMMKVFGLNSNNVSLEDVIELVLPEYKEIYLNALKDLIEKNLPYNIVYLIQNPVTKKFEYIHSTAEHDKEENIVFGVIKDFTRRKSAEDSLKAERNMLRLLIDNIPDKIFFKDAEGRYILNNASHLKRLGVGSQEEVLGKNAYDFFPEEAASEFLKEEMHLIKTGIKIEDKLEILPDNKNGELLYYLTNKIPIRDENGNVTGLIGISRNITDIKRHELILKESESKYRMLFELGSSAYLLIDTKTGQIIESNRAASELFGYTHEELVKMKNYQLSADPEETKKNNEETPVLQRPHHRILRKKEGTTFLAELIRSYFDFQNLSVHLTTIKDISESRKIEQAILENEERWRSAIEGSNQGLWDWNLETNEVYFSKLWKEMLGYSEEDIPNKLESWSTLVHPDDMPHVSEKLNRHLKGETKNYSCEQRILCKDGTYKWILDQGKIINYDSAGKPVRMVGTHTDISAIKLAEQKLRESEEIFAAAFHNSSAMIALSTLKEGIYIDINEQFLHTLGYSSHEVIGRSSNDLGIICERRDRDTIIREIENKGFIYGYECKFKTRSGKEIDVMISSVVITIKGESCLLSTLVDITGRKKMEEGLLKFKMSLEHSDDAVFITDKEGVIEYANNAFTKIYGYETEEVIGKTPRVIKSGLVPDSDYAGFWQKLLADKTVINEIPNRRKDGRIITVEGSNSSILDDNGEVIGFLGIHRDITDRKKAELIQRVIFNISASVLTAKSIEEYISLIREQLAALMDTTNFYAAFYDETTGILSTPFAKDEMDEISEWPAEKSLTGFIVLNNRSLLATQKDIMELHSNGVIDIIGTPPEIWIGVPLRVGENVIGAIVLQDYKDVNAFDEKSLEILEFVSGQISFSIHRKKIEDALQEKQDILNEAQRIAHIGSWSANALTGIFSWTDEMFNVFGVDHEIFVPTFISILELIHPDDRELFEHSLRRQFKGELEKGIEFRIFTFNGSTRFLSLSGAPAYNENGEVIGAIGAVQDITERVEADIKLKRYMDELKEINATKDKFFSIISHDLKNPFHSINAALGILLDDPELSPDERKTFLVGLQNTSGRAYSLLENLMLWSRNQMGQIEFAPEKIQLTEAVLATLDLVSNSSALKNISLTHDIDDNIYVSADRNMLETVLRNLITNAIKFTPDNGTVEVKAEVEGATVEVSVKDNGVGIEEEDLSKLFKIDKAFSTKGTKNESGSGLGLILCKDFVERNGGVLSVESKVGEGSVFRFTLKKG